MTPMWRRLTTVSYWRERAPYWTTAVLAGLLATDLAHSVWALRVPFTLHPSPPPKASRAMPAVFNVGQVVSAHLFGEPAAPGTSPEHAPETHLALALSGIVATADPASGYAILGEKDKATRLYRTGDALVGAAGGHLARVFADRVILDLDGRMETLRLPRKGLLEIQQPTAAVADESIAAQSPPGQDPEAPPTPAESWFGNLYAEQNNVDANLGGMLLHPAKRLQRQYGLRDGDRLTVVNGVTITDPDVLADVLKTSGNSLSLTLTRDGVERTVKLSVSN